MERQSYLRKGQARVGNRGDKQEQEASIVTPGIGEGGTGKGGRGREATCPFLPVPTHSSSPCVNPSLRQTQRESSDKLVVCSQRNN